MWLAGLLVMFSVTSFWWGTVILLKEKLVKRKVLKKCGGSYSLDFFFAGTKFFLQVETIQKPFWCIETLTVTMKWPTQKLFTDAPFCRVHLFSTILEMKNTKRNGTSCTASIGHLSLSCACSKLLALSHETETLYFSVLWVVLPEMERGMGIVKMKYYGCT